MAHGAIPVFTYKSGRKALPASGRMQCGEAGIACQPQAKTSGRDIGEHVAVDYTGHEARLPQPLERELDDRRRRPAAM